ncbi:MAG: hypothetical protein KGN00_00560 [Chloroflexota bacterium]|nr:hypothetical protein [Chloroflexota bacterium]MDE3192150.1 hypothetical protein [Chloroflexota bacterium]
MPPAVVPLALVAIGVPAALRALIGRPRALGAAWLAAFAGAAVAQTLGELTSMRLAVLGDAQLGAALVATLVTSLLLVVRESAARGR